MSCQQQIIKFKIGDIIIWRYADKYCIKIIINIDITFQNYYVKTLKYSQCDPLLYNHLDFDWTHSRYTKLTDLEKVKYL